MIKKKKKKKSTLIGFPKITDLLSVHPLMFQNIKTTEINLTPQRNNDTDEHHNRKVLHCALSVGPLYRIIAPALLIKFH